MTPIRVRDLFVTGLVTAVIAYLLVRLAYGSLPSFPAPAGVTLGVLGLAEAIAGNVLRARVERRRGARPVEPLVAARAVLLAQASALAGAVVAGLWAGLLAYVLPLRGTVSAAGNDTVAAGIGLLCAIGLVAGALWLERCCRTPDDESPGPEDDPAGR